ncbi:DNA polymerase zeta catalytic subunit-like [Hyposmocoma kahamanoa]|uniref:DNA polymerase zeta catalytic subunit-like n=1 Tax=Hyposmocoma kahamanoa TaxID=1477025 RepID=UPI000E6D6B86|nr:DNA polymerase zeta catalytic subunit-like [Hyposmocoma kahamanoa]
MYESPDQEKPVYEAKGIETVRRDGCPAGVKILQRSLIELFSHGDMSRVKRMVMSTLCKLADGSLPPQDLFFTREYHGPAGYRPGAAAPPNEIAKRIASRDRRAVPRSGERVAWQVCAGPPGAPLVKLARTPEELVADSGLTPHVSYYALRVLLPPLHRCLSLLGVNVFKWWAEVGHTREAVQKQTRGGIARYMWRRRCALCGAPGVQALCAACAGRGGGRTAIAALMTRCSHADTCVASCHMICNSCCGHTYSQCCNNTECPVLWRRLTAQHRFTDVQQLIHNLPEYFHQQIDF